MQQKAEEEPGNEASAYQVIWETNAVVVIAYAVSLYSFEFLAISFVV